MNKDENRRDQYRYARHDRLFVQVIASNKKHDVSNATVFCHSCDASIKGLKLELEMQLAINSVVDLWMEFEGLDRKFYLRGRVCWCDEKGELNLYQTGISLEKLPTTDYALWAKLLESFAD